MKIQAISITFAACLLFTVIGFYAGQQSIEEQIKPNQSGDVIVEINDGTGLVVLRRISAGGRDTWNTIINNTPVLVKIWPSSYR